MQIVLKKIIPFTIIVGVLAFAINMMFGENTITFITQETTNGIRFYKFNFWEYYENFRNSIETQATNLTLHTNPLEWRTISSNILQEQFWVDLGNNMAFILNWIIFGLNILLYPFRIGSYVLNFAFTIIGVNMQNSAENGLKWLVDVISFLTKLEIPYVLNN